MTKTTHAICNQTSAIRPEDCAGCDRRAVCSHPAPTPANILVVEYNTATRSLIMRLLTQSGHHVCGVATIEEAMAGMAACTPNLILLDNDLPDMDGSTFLIEERPHCCAHIPIVMITASDNLKLAVQAFRAGVADFLVKPVDPDILLLVVGRVLEKTRLTAERDRERVARQAAEAVSQAKSDFLANVGHDLRTASHQIKSFASLIRTAIGDAQACDLLADLMDGVDRLTPFVDDLTDLGAIERGKMGHNPVNFELLPLVHATIADFREAAARKGCNINLQNNIPAGCMLSGDHHQIHRVLRHILDNAIFFAYPETEIVITTAWHAENGFACTVEDVGPSIPTDELMSIFEPFAKSTTTDNGSGRTGVGLAFAKRIITAHGGEIWMENHPERSAVRCICTLPAKKE